MSPPKGWDRRAALARVATHSDEICKRYKAGETAVALEQRFGICDGSIRQILERHGVPLRGRRSSSGKYGPESRHWKGGRTILQGYVSLLLPYDHPFTPRMAHSIRATQSPRCFEHRWVMALHLGRPLERHETVHHINGDKLDNRIENLQLRNGRHGKGAVLECGACGSRDIRHVPL